MVKKVSAVLALAITACSSSAGIPASLGSNGNGDDAAHHGAHTNLFVGGRNAVYEYTLQGHLVRAITLTTHSSMVAGGGMAFDSSGYLYALKDYFDVGIYAPGSRQLVRTISNGIFEPIAIAVDRSDNLYVGNEENGAYGNVAVYAPGSTTPLRKITEGIYDPESLAFDSSGNLYVGNGSYADTVTVYSSTGALLRTITEGIADPESIALDRHDRLFVANTEDGAGRTVTVYEPGTTRLLQTITKGIDCPQALAVDSAGQLYVANFVDSTATVYAAKTRKLLRTISKKVGAPWSIAVDARDNLYVGSEGRTPHVDIYPPHHAAPAHAINSKEAWIPLALAFGPP